eukprot:TRINITY_DN10822_c0_g1_i3.p1 TRINITY_DN10822_c0_g1~~TRINITY_DN10822_c0_g1_i3.p1  ORF type:complete len:115 (-),score=7.38 TRINITY_DN10822_c0_g1_i3:299-643(-)
MHSQKCLRDLRPFSESDLDSIGMGMGLRGLDACRSEYVAGPSPTIADIVCYCEIGQCSVEMFGLFDLSKYPNILGWMERCKQIPGYTQAHELCYQIAPMVRAKVQTFNSLNSKL